MRVGDTRWSLIGAARGGDREAQRAFVERYRAVVVRLAERFGAAEEAEDVAQEVFVQLFSGALERAQPEGGSFRAYLHAVTRHTLGAQRARRQAVKRGGRVEVRSLGEHDPEELTQDALDREWFVRLLELAMERLRKEHPAYFEAVRGFLWEERAQGELAESLGRSVQDVRNHVHRGRKKLVAYLREEVARYESDPSGHETELELLGKLAGPG